MGIGRTRKDHRGNIHGRVDFVKGCDTSILDPATCRKRGTRSYPPFGQFYSLAPRLDPFLPCGQAVKVACYHVGVSKRWVRTSTYVRLTVAFESVSACMWTYVIIRRCEMTRKPRPLAHETSDTPPPVLHTNRVCHLIYRPGSSSAYIR